MRHSYLTIALNLLALCSVSFSVTAQKTAGELEIKQQQKDFETFRKGLLTIESRPDKFVSMDSIQQMLSLMEKQFSGKALSAVDEFKLYAKCINLVQSGHTQATPSKEVFKEYVLKAKSLPFDMVMVNKHLYVTGYQESKKVTKQKNKNQNTTIPEGAEIVRIDGLPISEWMKNIGQFIGSDEDDPVFEYVIAGQAFDFYRFLATEEHKSQLDVHYIVKRDTLVQSVKLTYPPVKLLFERFEEQEKQSKKDRRGFGEFKFIGADVAYFRFPTFVNSYGNDYSKYLEKCFEKIKKKKKIETIVVDLRGNGGGNVQTGFLSYFLESQEIVGSYDIVKRLKRGERRHIKKNTPEFRRYKKNMRQFNRFERKHPGFDGQLVSLPVDTSLIFHGNIIVLTDEGTFSAASLLASQLKTLRDAEIMGSRPGGSFYSCNAGTLQFVLPNSHISFIFNPKICASTLNGTPVNPAIKNVDVEIIPEYETKETMYKKNWEAVVKTALKRSKRK